jgi:hypothetical protein
MWCWRYNKNKTKRKMARTQGKGNNDENTSKHSLDVGDLGEYLPRESSGDQASYGLS